MACRDCSCNCYHPGGPRNTSQENKEHPLSGTFKDRISTQKNQDMGTWKASFGSDTCAPGGRGSVKDGGTLPEAGRGESKKRGENGGTHQLQQWEAGKKEEKGEKKKDGTLRLQHGQGEQDYGRLSGTSSSNQYFKISK